MMFSLSCIDECYVVRSPTVTTMERDWAFGNVVCLYCHWFSGFLFGFRDCLFVWSLCFSRRAPQIVRFVGKRSEISGTWLLPWSLCSRILSLSLRCRFCTVVPCQGVAVMMKVDRNAREPESRAIIPSTPESWEFGELTLSLSLERVAEVRQNRCVHSSSIGCYPCSWLCCCGPRLLKRRRLYLLACKSV
jgi:hypothetical protein